MDWEGRKVVADAKTLAELEEELRRWRPREVVQPVTPLKEETKVESGRRRKRARRELDDSAEYTEYLKKLCREVETDDLFGFVVNPLVV